MSPQNEDHDDGAHFGQALLWGPERKFLLLFLTQTLSLLGTSVAGFALSASVFSSTSSVSTYTLLMFVCSVPGLLLWPLAGILADRYSRRACIVACDVLAALASAWFWRAYSAAAAAAQPGEDPLDSALLRQLFGVSLLISVANALQAPCFEASVALLVRPRLLSRAQGLEECAAGLVSLLSPLLACTLTEQLGLPFVLGADVALAALAVATLLLAVDLPEPPVSEAGASANEGSWLDDVRYGYRYLQCNPQLRGLLAMFAVSNFCTAYIFQLLPPLVLSLDGVDSLGYISSLSGTGMLVGSLVIALVDVTPRHHSPLAFVYALLAFQGATMMFAVNEYDPLLITTLGFLYSFCDPLIRNVSSTLWSKSVPIDVQGRVFAFRDFVATAAMPLALITGGPLADWFEAALATEPTEGSLVAVCRSLGLPVGRGRGICLLFVLFGSALFALGVPACVRVWRAPPTDVGAITAGRASAERRSGRAAPARPD